MARSRLLPDRHARRCARAHRSLVLRQSLVARRARDRALRRDSADPRTRRPRRRRRRGGEGALGSRRDVSGDGRLAGGPGRGGHGRLRQGRGDRHRRAARDDDECRALLERAGRNADRRSGGLRDRGGRHADDLRRGRHRRPRRHGSDRRDLRARDRHPPDRRPLHHGAAPGGLRRPPDRRSRGRAGPLRHVRAADGHAGCAAGRVEAHRRHATVHEGSPGEVVRAFA